MPASIAALRPIPRLPVSSIAAAALLAIGASSCALTSSEMSCSLKNSSGGMEQCIEYTDFEPLSSLNAKASLAILCKLFNADIVDKRCASEGALVGCRKERDGAWTQTHFYWATEDKQTAGSFGCPSNDTRVGPDRQPLAGGAVVDMSIAGPCSPMTASPAVTITFQNNSANAVSAYWVDPTCKEVFYAVIQPGKSYMQATFVGHPWRIRQGAEDSKGTVVKEFIAKEAEAPAVTVQIP